MKGKKGLIKQDEIPSILDWPLRSSGAVLGGFLKLTSFSQYICNEVQIKILK